MSLSLIRGPSQNRVSSTENTTYSITTNGYGVAVLTGGSGLSNGDTILIHNSFTSYNGFFLLSSYGPNTFRLINVSVPKFTGTNYLEYTQDHDNVTVFKHVSSATLKYSCVHLPITYKLTSTKFPTNTFDTTRTVTAFYNDNGFIKITVSGSITADALDWLTIDGTSVDDLDGQFQILTKHSSTQFTINAPYSLASGSVYTYLSATATRYYNNYCAKIRVFAGLPAAHLWYALNPYEQVTEVKITPDNSNNVIINVADIVKSKIDLFKNRPNYDSMPYDLDRFCFFYIDYAESYDESDGSTVSESTSAYTSSVSVLEGKAVDAKLEFKNRYAGFMNNFVFADSSNLAKFLTEASQPVLFDGNYFDVSFILTDSNVYIVQRIADTVTGELLPSSEGILRKEITIGDQLDQTVYLLNAVENVAFNSALALWATAINAFNTIGSSSVTGVWTAGQTTNKTIQIRIQTSGNPAKDISIPISITVALSGAYAGTATVSAYIIQNGIQATVENSAMTVAGSPYTITGTLTYTTANNGFNTFLQIAATRAAGTDDLTMVVTLNTPAAGVAITFDEESPFSETKTLLVNQDCFNESIYLTWKNPNGGFDYWLFTGFKDHRVNILETQERDRNIYPTWDESYQEPADTIKQETSRRSRKEFTIRSQNVTEDQINYIKGIKTSSLVQQLSSKYDRRTVIVDRSSFRIKTDGDKLYNIEFSIAFTDEIPSQSL